MKKAQKKKPMITRNNTDKKKKEPKRLRKGPEYKLTDRFVEVDPRNAKTYSGKRTSCGYRKT